MEPRRIVAARKAAVTKLIDLYQDMNPAVLKGQLQLKDQIIKLQSDLIEQLKAQQPTDELRALRQRVKADSLNEEEAQNLFSKRGWGRLGHTHLRNCLDQIYKLEEQLAVCTRRAEDDRRLISRLLWVATAMRSIAGNPITADPLIFAEARRALAAKPSEAVAAQPTGPEDPLDSDHPSGTKEPT